AFADSTLDRLGPALVAGGAVYALGALTLARRGQDTEAGDAATRTPFDFWAVLQMALLLAAIAFAARAASQHLGAGGVILVSALSGLADVDAAIVTAAGMIGGAVKAPVAAKAMGAAIVTNTVAKAVYAAVLGGGRFALAFSGVSAAALAAGLALFVALSP
ncbi:MAG TPA: DUF4010 domain-containing protein, partial [Beijerinckiaceae bacterium]|nr:DUF4010 domain-containing protein [Beijerinckiaceae bacterium]